MITSADEVIYLTLTGAAISGVYMLFNMAKDELMCKLIKIIID